MSPAGADFPNPDPDPDPDPKPDPEPAYLNVSIATNYSYYYMYETMRMTVTVRDANNVPNAYVTLKLTTASGRVRQGTGYTASNGTITFRYSISYYDGRGYYTIEVTAEKDAATGSATKTVRVY